ncbi:MAG: hypothetical protein QXG57_06030 [Thermofilaceae archaeon]
MGGEPESVTVDDVRAALKVIRIWLRQQEEVERVMRALAVRIGASYMNPQYQIVRELLLSGVKSKPDEVEHELESELTPEERERLKRIAESIK